MSLKIFYNKNLSQFKRFLISLENSILQQNEKSHKHLHTNNACLNFNN